jgi:hypothetical protein
MLGFGSDLTRGLLVGAACGESGRTTFNFGDEGHDITVAEGNSRTGPETIDSNGIALTWNVVGLQGFLDGSAGGNFDNGG